MDIDAGRGSPVVINTEAVKRMDKRKRKRRSKRKTHLMGRHARPVITIFWDSAGGRHQCCGCVAVCRCHQWMGWTLYTKDKSDSDICMTGSTHLS